MKRTTIFLDEGTERDLKALAAEDDEPVASLVREAIGDYLVRRKRKARALSFVGAGRSGRTDIAETHEALLWRELTPHGAGEPASKRRRKTAPPPGGKRGVARPRR